MSQSNATDEAPTGVGRQRIEMGPYGSLEVPADHKTTVETKPGSPHVFRFLYSYTVVAVTGGSALQDMVPAIEGTFARYVGDGAEWVDGLSGPEILTEGDTRRFTREFTWTQDEYLPMVSVVSCISDENSSMVVHGSCAVNVGEAELDTLRCVVASAQLP